MKMIRTTISLPEKIHKELLLRGIKEKKSLGQLITENIRNREKDRTALLSDIIAEKGDIVLRRLVRKLKPGKVDWVSEIKKQRQERTEHLSKSLD